MKQNSNTKKTLIICDVQPDVVQKLPQPRLFVDLISIAVQAARRTRRQETRILYTMLKFDEGYSEISPSHPRLGILRRLPHTKWFTSSALSIPPQAHEKVVTRCTFLPQATDTEFLGALQQSQSDHEHEHEHEYTVVGYGPTVQAVCHLLGDVVVVSSDVARKVQILRECVSDECPERCKTFLDHGLLFNEQVVSLVDYLEELDLLHEQIYFDCTDQTNFPPRNKYVSDCGRGGHISLFMPYLLRIHGYTQWPTQPWYKELVSNKQYYCPLGKQIIQLCDEPQFGSGTRFFLMGRQYLDEKNLLYQLVPDMMPSTFHSLEAAQDYAAECTDEELVWFLKKVNQNGGRAVTVTYELPTEPLEEDEQLQVHVPRPLLFDSFKCHVKTYQYIADTSAAAVDGESNSAWQLYMHDLFYLATASHPWSPNDLSDDVQITTMRTHRLYPENPWRLEWNLTETCRTNMQAVLQRAVEQGKLISRPPPTDEQDAHSQQNPAAAIQFEINSADWMLDEDGRVYLIECNGIPVLYDAGMPQELVTKGLRLYDRLYKEDPDNAVVNDHDLLQEAIGLALTGKLPKSSLWKHITTIPS